MERRIKKTFLHTSILFLYKKIIFFKRKLCVFFMTAAEFGLPVYTHPTTSGNKHIPSGGSSGQILRWSADGTATWGADNNTTYSDATTSAHGLMTAADKTKLNGIATSAGKYTLVATWSGSTPDVVKTITGCVVGQPVFLIYNTNRWEKDTSQNNINSIMLDEFNYTAIRIKSGANPQYGWINFGIMESIFRDNVAYHDGILSLILIPTATSIVLDLGRQQDGDDIIYVYKQ